MSRTKKGKGTAVVVEEKARFRELHYTITEDVMGYTNILRQLRMMLAADGGEILGIPTLPSEAGKGKRLYIKLHLRCDTSSCILFIRASDLYVIGYESAVDLVSLKPDDGRAQEIDEHFASEDLRGRVEEPKVRHLSFEGNYNSLVKNSSYNTLNTIPLGFSALKKAVKILGGKFDSEKQAATKILKLIFTFSEATRFTILESYITTNFKGDMAAVRMTSWLYPWLFYWGKISQVIINGDTGRNPNLVDMMLKLGPGPEDGYLETVEQARKIVAIMPNPM